MYKCALVISKTFGCAAFVVSWNFDPFCDECKDKMKYNS